MWKKFAFVGLSLILTLGFISAPSVTANAVVTKTVHVDCLAQQPGWVWGTVYLFPQEALTVTFEDCDWDLYIDSDPNPSVNYLSQSLGDGDGSITFSSDGTYVISSNMTQGSNQGTWYAGGNSDNYIYLEPHGAPNQLAFIGVDIVNEDVTSVPGMHLLSSPSIHFPTSIDSDNLLSTDVNLAHCLQYVPNSPGDTYVFVETPLETNVSGDVKIRTISTNPVTSFTDYLEQPDGYFGASPLLNINHLVYEHFDPLHPADGLVGCGSERSQDGDYLNTGQILSNRYFETDVSLAAGEYTIVSAFMFPMSAADWNSNVGWTPFEEQAVNIQIWGPEQLTTNVPINLAQTGTTLNSLWGAMALTASGVMLLLLRRKRKANI